MTGIIPTPLPVRLREVGMELIKLGQDKAKTERINMEIKTISLPKLNNLSPTMESTALKLMEETGGVASHRQVPGLKRGADNHRRRSG